MDVFVGNRVRMARVMANMSQQKLGNILDLSFQQVQKYEKGSNRIGGSRLQQIAKALNVKVSFFFDEGRTEDKRADADLVTQMLSTPYGVDLARAFVAIKHNQDRHTVAHLAEVLARPHEKRPEAASKAA